MQGVSGLSSFHQDSRLAVACGSATQLSVREEGRADLLEISCHCESLIQSWVLALRGALSGEQECGCRS